jgi:cardiolipin synthase
MPWVATAYYGVVLKGGARIYEYLPRMLHAKTAIVDNWAIVGSSNFNRRSLVHDFEVDLVLAKDESRAELVRAFERDLTESEQVTAARGGWTAFLGRLVSRLLKNWI